jgi:uncharacterized protein YcaQ
MVSGAIEEILIVNSDGGTRRSYMRPSLLAEAGKLGGFSNRIRILSPFDPALRDRKRAERLFGFHYRIEVFVPEPQRRYGYYVFPVMEADRMVGRIDLKCQRSEGMLSVTAFWPEPGVAIGRGRIARLEAELDRLGRFTECRELVFAADWLREPKVM